MFIDQNQFLSTFFYNRRILITSVFHFVATVEEREEDMTQSSGALSIMTKPTETSWTNQEKIERDCSIKIWVPTGSRSPISISNQNFYYFKRIRVETSIFRKERWLFRSDRTDWWKRRTLKVDLFPENFLLPFILRPKSAEILAYWKATLASVVGKQIPRCRINFGTWIDLSKLGAPFFCAGISLTCAGIHYLRWRHNPLFLSHERNAQESH